MSRPQTVRQFVVLCACGCGEPVNLYCGRLKKTLIGHHGRVNAPSLAEKFWRHVGDDRPAGDCWRWQGHIGSTGYGRINHYGRKLKAHRVAYELTKGPIPDGLVVMHSCDNPPCVNPAHLSVGTHKDNSQDAKAKGRLKPPPVGDGKWRARVTHCRNGHEYTAENTSFVMSGGTRSRRCRACSANVQRAYKDRQKQRSSSAA